MFRAWEYVHKLDAKLNHKYSIDRQIDGRVYRLTDQEGVKIKCIKYGLKEVDNLELIIYIYTLITN